jgi:peptide/nickel transport system substrate-binding protein
VANGPHARTPLGSDPRVRKAFELALDRTALIQVVYNGMYTASAQAVPPASPFFVPEIKPPARDVARAQALLKETGLKLPVTITLTVPNSPDIAQAAEVIQSMVKDAGFDVHISQMEFAASLDASQHGNLEAYMLAWSGRPDADGNLWTFLHTGGASNDGHYSNATVDDLLDHARAINDVGQRRDLYKQMWQQVVQDDPIIYLWNTKNIVGMSRKLQGFRAVPDGMIRLQGLSMAQ